MASGGQSADAMRQRHEAGELRRVEELAAARLEQRLDDVADFLLDRDKDQAYHAVHDNRCHVLTAAAAKGKQDLVAALLRRLLQRMPARLQYLPPAGLAAAAGGHAQCLHLILDACRTCPATLQLLLEKSGCNPHMTALMMAARGSSPGHVECVRLLLQHSPEQLVMAVDTEGKHALMHAAAGGCAPCMELLLAHSPGVQVDVETPGRFNALRMAAAKHLLDTKAAGGAAGGAAAGGAGSAAALAAGRECVELLLAHGAQLPDGVDKEVRGAVRVVMQAAVQRARVPDMATRQWWAWPWLLGGGVRGRPRGRKAVRQQQQGLPL